MRGMPGRMSVDWVAGWRGIRSHTLDRDFYPSFGCLLLHVAVGPLPLSAILFQPSWPGRDLGHHLPFTIFSRIIPMILAAIIIEFKYALFVALLRNSL